jgi:hypothetical protein
MHRQRVVDSGADPGLAQMLAQPVAVGGADHILVVDMRRRVAPRWQLQLQPGEPDIVAGSPLAIGDKTRLLETNGGLTHAALPLTTALLRS